MQTIYAIAACDLAGGLGYKGDLPWDVPEDKAFFRRHTLGELMIMGYKTYLAMPPRALADRESLVLSRKKRACSYPNVTFISNFDQCLKHIKNCGNKKPYVIGGGEIFELFFSHHMIHELYLSLIPSEYQCDTLFPLYALKSAKNKSLTLKGKGFSVFRYLF